MGHIKDANDSLKLAAATRKMSTPSEQKQFLKSLSCAVTCSARPTMAVPGAGLPDACRMDGSVQRDQLAGLIKAKGTLNPDDVVKYLNAELRKRVCVFDDFGTKGAAKLAEADYKKAFAAGADICG